MRFSSFTALFNYRNTFNEHLDIGEIQILERQWISICSIREIEKGEMNIEIYRSSY